MHGFCKKQIRNNICCINLFVDPILTYFLLASELIYKHRDGHLKDLSFKQKCGHSIFHNFVFMAVNDFPYKVILFTVKTNLEIR